jgi:glutathione S-transferase
MLDVYLDPPTINSRKLLAGLELLGAPYKITHVSYIAGAHKRSPYTDLNPNGVLPAAKDGDFILWESDAILQYVADAYGGERYYPRDLRTRADINRWLFWEAAHWQPSCYVFFFENAFKPVIKAPTDTALVEKETPRWRHLANVLDGQLAKSKWVVGDTVTIADIAMAAPMHLHEQQRLPLQDFSNIRRWIAEVEKLPCWQKTQGAVDAATSLKTI